MENLSKNLNYKAKTFSGMEQTNLNQPWKANILVKDTLYFPHCDNSFLSHWEDQASNDPNICNQRHLISFKIM